MRCLRCETENPERNRFCESCGARLVAKCPSCDYLNTPYAQFCGACGAALASPKAGWMARRGNLAGERKQATVLFADIVSSTELVVGLDPEEAMEHLQPAIATMCDVIERYDGTVVRTLGDGVMALFGAPRAQEGHAFLACKAALAIQSALSAGSRALKLRIGLHSGEIVSDAPVSDPTMERGAHGSTIHLASRLPPIATPGGICLSEDCYRLVRSYCDVRPLGRHTLKGFPEPVAVCSLLGLKTAVASQQFVGANLTPFLGRDHELEMLQRALRRAENGDARVIGIAGPPGSGKSRLCYEFAEWCRNRNIPVYEARALQYGYATPLQPVLEFLRLFFHILPTDGPGIARNRIAAHLSAIGPTFNADVPLLCEFLGIDCGEAPSSRLHPRARRARLLDIIRHLIRQRGVATSVIIVEDLHWLDEASEDFVTTLVDAVADTRTMVVVNYRPAYATPWMTWSCFEQLPLPDLSPAETDALVGELIGLRPDLSHMRQRVAARSGGNPFFTEELVRSLAENGALVGDAGNYSPGWRTDQGGLPPTVQAVVGARIDRLNEADKAILQIGAVIGKEFPLVVLGQMASISSEQVSRALDRLCDAGLIHKQPGIEGRWYAFRHPLIQEVAYATQLKPRRSALHALAARAMETFHRDRLDEFAGLLAYHFEAAGQVHEAANYAARAAIWIGSTNSAEAIKNWRRVRLLLLDQPKSRQNNALRIMAGGQIAWQGWREGLTAEAAKPFIEEALVLARETDDTMIPMLLFAEGRITLASGGPADTYVERVKEGLALLRETGNAGRIATLNAALSQAYGWAGMLNEALEASNAALQRIAAIDKFDHQFLGYNVEHWVMSLRGRILVRLGRFAEAEQCFDTMIQIEHTIHDPTVQNMPHGGYVDLANCRGDALLAQRHSARVTAIAERHGSPYMRVFALYCSGTVNSLTKSYDAAVRDFGEAVAFSRAAKVAMESQPEILASLADCRYQAGDLENAISVAKEAIELARQRSGRLAECRALITYGAALRTLYGVERLREVKELFDLAEQLIRLTGATIYEPILAHERARMSALIHC